MEVKERLAIFHKAIELAKKECFAPANSEEFENVVIRAYVRSLKEERKDNDRTA